MITLTDMAAKEIKRLLVENELDGAMLRMGVRGGGCSGLAYMLGFDREVRETDNVFDIDGIRVVVDVKSYLYLKGTELDYTSDVMGAGFKFNNPNISRGCGCGSSQAD